MPRLLIIDDDYSLFVLLAEYLDKSGFSCAHAADGNAGIVSISAESWDAIILDVMLPGKNGHEVLQYIRSNATTSTVPVLMLTARGKEDDKVLGLELGADDYLAKPFGAKELVARLRALLRRAGRPGVSATVADPILRLDDLVIDRDSMTLVQGESRIEIIPTELRLLELFAETPGKIIGRETLYYKVFGHRVIAQDRSLDMMISRLRKKLGPRRDGGERIRAARGEGYMFLLPGDKQ